MALPVDDTPMLEIESWSEAEAQLWVTLREVCELFSGLPWVLVGGLIVRLLEAEHGRETQFATMDVDAIIDVRAMTLGKREAAQRLLDHGFQPERPDGKTVYGSRGPATSSMSSRPRALDRKQTS